jgi:DNA-binding MarR family transcriptional regulator
MNSVASRIEALFHAVVSRFTSIPARSGGLGEITVAQIKALMMINLSGAVSLNQLAAVLGVSSAAASEQIDRLVRSSLVRRERSLSDRRVVKLTLRAPGRRVLERLSRTRAEKARKLVGAVGAIDARRFVAALETLHSILEKVPR